MGCIRSHMGSLFLLHRWTSRRHNKLSKDAFLFRILTTDNSREPTSRDDDDLPEFGIILTAWFECQSEQCEAETASRRDKFDIHFSVTLRWHIFAHIVVFLSALEHVEHPYRRQNIRQHTGSTHRPADTRTEQAKHTDADEEHRHMSCFGAKFEHPDLQRSPWLRNPTNVRTQTHEFCGEDWHRQDPVAYQHRSSQSHRAGPVLIFCAGATFQKPRCDPHPCLTSFAQADVEARGGRYGYLRGARAENWRPPTASATARPVRRDAQMSTSC